MSPAYALNVWRFIDSARSHSNWMLSHTHIRDIDICLFMVSSLGLRNLPYRKKASLKSNHGLLLITLIRSSMLMLSGIVGLRCFLFFFRISFNLITGLHVFVGKLWLMWEIIGALRVRHLLLHETFSYDCSSIRFKLCFNGLSFSICIVVVERWHAVISIRPAHSSPSIPLLYHDIKQDLLFRWAI